MSIAFSQIEKEVKLLPEGKVRITLFAAGKLILIGEFNKVEMTLKSGKLSRVVANYFSKSLAVADSIKVESIPASRFAN